MKATVIKDSDISALKISSLPTKPTAPKSMGGMGYGAREMKEAFDKLPLFIIERFNALIEDILSVGTGSISGAVKTGLKDEHTLYDLFCDIKSGEIATYLTVLGKNLSTHISEIKSDIHTIKQKVDHLTEAEKEEKCQE